MALGFVIRKFGSTISCGQYLYLPERQIHHDQWPPGLWFIGGDGIDKDNE
jgi:hypothetical protein